MSKAQPLPWKLSLYTVHIAALGAALMILPACRDASRAETWVGTIDTLPSGVVIVVNRQAGPWSHGVQWRVREQVRLRELQGGEEEVFGRIAAVEFDASGNLYVFDGQANELRVFDSSGTHVRTIGRRGAGPREFESVVGLSWSPGGSLWLVDAGNGRYASLGDDGALETVRRPIGTYTLPWLGGWSDAGSFYDQASAVADDGFVSMLVRMVTPGSPVDTIVLPTTKLPVPRRGSMSFPLPFAPRQLWAFDPTGRIWAAVDSEYRLTALDLAGDTVAVVVGSHEPVRLSADQEDSVATYVAELARRFNVTVSSSMIPRQAPVLRWMTVDDRGFLWLCANGVDPCDELDVFDRDGRLLGTVDLPQPATDRAVIRGRRIVYVSEDSVGTPLVLAGEIVGRQ